MWQRDLNNTIKKEVWCDVISNIGWATIGVGLSIVKMCTDINLHHHCCLKLGILKDNNCWKCGNESGTYLQAFWECPLVFLFWAEVLKHLEKWTGLPIPASPTAVFTGDRSLMPTGFTEDMFGLVAAGFTVASRLFLQIWSPQATD